MTKEINNNLLNNEEEEMVYCECKYCGEEFEADYEKEVCEACEKAIEEASNPELIKALAEEFGCAPCDIIEREYNVYNIYGFDYLVLTEDEANEKVKEFIEDNIWTLSSHFLSSITEVDYEVFEAIQANGRCEGNNDAIMSIINATNTSMNYVVEEAISWDGRGLFLSQYDGQEIVVYADGEYYYCYRQ